MLSRIGSRIEIPQLEHYLIDVRRRTRYGWPHRWWGKPYPHGGATPCDLSGCGRQTRGMALDSAPIFSAPWSTPRSSPPRDDGARLRRTAQRQWAARRDLERRLHDGAALRVSALTLRLGLLRHLHPDEAQESPGGRRGTAGRAAPRTAGAARHRRAGSTRRCSTRPGSAPRCARPSAAVRYRCGSTHPTSGSARTSRVPSTSRCSAACPRSPPTPVEIVVRREADDARRARLGRRGLPDWHRPDGVRLLGGTVAVGPASVPGIRL